MAASGPNGGFRAQGDARAIPEISAGQRSPCRGSTARLPITEVQSVVIQRAAVSRQIIGAVLEVLPSTGQACLAGEAWGAWVVT